MEPSPLYVKVDTDGSLLVRGVLEAETAEQLDRAIAGVTKPGIPVVVDMAQITFIDTAGVRCLVRAFEATGVRVVICNPSQVVRPVLAIVDDRIRAEAWVIQTD